MKGREVYIEANYWAGNGNNDKKVTGIVDGNPNLANVERFEKELETSSLLVSVCYDDLCSSHDGVPWTLNKENPCDKDKRRRGIVCGECEEGHSRVPGLSSQVRNCCFLEKVN